MRSWGLIPVWGHLLWTRGWRDSLVRSLLEEKLRLLRGRGADGLCLGFQIFSQKLTSWVFNDQPCECADVGQSRTIGRAAKIGWEKKLSRKLSPIRRHGSDFIYTKNSARPRSDFLYIKNAPPPRADFLYTHFFRAFVRFCK